jgi:hypothetical protein
VTGVQTCALPISLRFPFPRRGGVRGEVWAYFRNRGRRGKKRFDQFSVSSVFSVVKNFVKSDAVHLKPETWNLKFET